MICFDDGKCGAVIGCKKWHTYADTTGVSKKQIDDSWHKLSPSGAFNTVARQAIVDKCNRLHLGLAPQ